MLKPERFNINSFSVKTAEIAGISLRDCIKTVVRYKELSVAENKKSFVDGKNAIESAHTGVNAMNCEESIVNDVLKLDAGQFLKDRKEVLDLRAEVGKLPELAKITALLPADRAHIAMLAHQVYNRVDISEVYPEMFDTEKGGVSMSDHVREWYKSGKQPEAFKEQLRTLLFKVFGTEGDYFYAVRTKRSDISGEDVRHFLASFHKKPAIGKNTAYNYVLDLSPEAQTKAFSDLCAVILANPSKHTVVKPEKPAEKPEEKAAEKPAEEKPAEKKLAESRG